MVELKLKVEANRRRFSGTSGAVCVEMCDIGANVILEFQWLYSFIISIFEEYKHDPEKNFFSLFNKISQISQKRYFAAVQEL